MTENIVPVRGGFTADGDRLPWLENGKWQLTVERSLRVSLRIKTWTDGQGETIYDGTVHLQAPDRKAVLDAAAGLYDSAVQAARRYESYQDLCRSLLDIYPAEPE